MKQLLISLSMFWCLSQLIAQAPVQIHGALAVEGNQIVNQGGSPISFAGASLFWSNTGWGGEDYYNADVVNWLASDWGVTLIRAAMGVEDSGGYITNVSNKQRVINVVDAAIEEGVYVIIDWHSHHAEDYEAEAIQFFEEMATLYSDYDNVIYEIYNEPVQISWNNVIKPYAESVIAAIRAIDSDNLIVVGTPTWSQDVDVASNNPIVGYSNIAYALHFYAGSHGQWLRNKATTAMNNGIALMATEWGTVNYDANGPVAYDAVEEWMAFFCDHNISHCNWAVNDKNESASALKPGASVLGGWSQSNLTASGILVKEIIENWDADCNTTLPIEHNNLDNLSFQYELFPNPVTTNLKLKCTSTVRQDINISLVNALGEALFSETLYNFNGEYSKTIDAKSFPESIFFIVIKSPEGIISEKVMKQ
jgi:hypothetical protein